MLSLESIISLLSPIQKLVDPAGLTEDISCAEHENAGVRKNEYYQTAKSPQQMHRAAPENSTPLIKQDSQGFPL